MISRGATKTLAEIYERRFSTHYRETVNYRHFDRYRLELDKLYDCLYAWDYDPGFLALIKALYPYGPRQLKELIMRLHTGESLLPVTADWSWEERCKLGQRLLRDLAEDILIWFHSPDTGRYVRERIEDQVPTLVRQLELDGYVFRNGHLLFSEAAVLDVQEEQGVLQSLIRGLGLDNSTVMEHHLELSESDYVDGKWDNSISNSRKFLESVLQEVAMRHCLLTSGHPLGSNKYDSPAKVRGYLEDRGLLQPKEVKAVASVYALLSDTGGHPYIAAQDQARLMRYLALTFAHFALLRLRGALAART